jgi:CubicO group peptidase (beta-lactamase class C family)
MKLRLSLAAVAALIIASHQTLAQADLPMAKAETVGMSSKRLERIHAFIQGYIDRNEIAGAVTLVARKGKVVHFDAQGMRYKEERLPMERETIFSLMSMTKPIVSTALMMLWEDGRFLLDDPISKWLPSYANKTVIDPVSAQRVPARPVTVRHILTHTSGLSLAAGTGPNPLTDNPGEEVVARRLRAEGASASLAVARADHERAEAGRLPFGGPQGRQLSDGETAEQTGTAPRERPKTVAEAIERAANTPLAFQPGDRWQYGSSTDFVAVLVEKMSGMTIDEFVRTKIFQPLGMRDTHYNIPREKVSRVAAVYRPDRDGTITLLRKPEAHEPTTYFPGVAGLNGTAADYFRFSQMLLNGGEYDGQRLLGRMTVDMMITNQIGAGKPVYIRGDGYGFGLGFGVLTNPAKSPDALSIGTFTWGGADGTLFWIDPQEDLIGILMVQLNPYTRSEIRPLFSVVVSQAITDSLAGQKPRIMGHDTPK